MSMEIYVLSDSALASIADWQHALVADGRALRLSEETPIAELHGGMRVVLDDVPTMFECSNWPVADIIATYPHLKASKRWKYALAFRWGGDLDAGVAAYAAASSYARATRGVVYDCTEGKIISAQRAAEIADEIDGSRMQFAEALATVMAKLKNNLTG